MKPIDWKLLTEEERTAFAKDLLGSLRGQLIVSQAFYRAIEAMKKDRHPEVSNIEDMEVIMDSLFPLYKQLQGAQKMLFEQDAQARKMKLDAEMNQTLRPPRTGPKEV